jgi:hypothetical protein
MMGFMWGRILFKKTPANSQAAEAVLQSDGTSAKAQADDEKKYVFIEVPKLKGRGVLLRDYFKVEENSFRNNEKQVISEEVSKGIDKRLFAMIRLDAVSLGERPLAFINGKVLAIGDKLIIDDGKEQYICEVIEIEGEKVSLKCRDEEFTLRLTELFGGN